MSMMMPRAFTLLLLKSYHRAVCTIFPEVIKAGKEHNLYVCLSSTWQSEFSFMVLAAKIGNKSCVYLERTGYINSSLYVSFQKQRFLIRKDLETL